MITKPNTHYCSPCRKLLPVDRFSPSGMSRPSGRCRTCCAARMTKYFWKRSGLYTSFDQWLAAKTSPCDICQKLERGTNKTGRRRHLATDHNHTTGQVRGHLCNDCNKGLGFFLDSPSLLRLAATYLDDWNKKGLGH